LRRRIGMQVIPINEAEAIIEPFWDGGSSEHPKDKMSMLDAYEVTIHGSTIGEVKQTWCSVAVQIDRAEVDKTAISMERKCDILIDGYDVFRVFASVPSWVKISVKATIDGKEQLIMDGVRGVDTYHEFDGSIYGSHMTKLILEFAICENRPAKVDLSWLGLSNREKQDYLESKKSPYSPEWEGFLITEPKEFKPELNIFFDSDELEDIRNKIKEEPYKSIFDGLKRQAEEGLTYYPEADIGTFIPNPDRRWCRTRDLSKKRTAGIMEVLAFVGLVEKNVEMLIMAARMAISAAHCTYWCESIMGVFPGATWHHRSFTEEIYCRACALVLDWAGVCITPHGKQVIRDAIIMKGLPRIESDFKRMEYIRFMNQGIVFSSGRIIGLLSLIPEYPRYKSMLMEAEQDLHEMIENYVHEDGGTLEGPGYWNFTFSQAMPLFYALSRFHNKTLHEYATETLLKTGDYALSMLSIADGGITLLPINDCHSKSTINPGLVAAYCKMSKNPEWKSLYQAMKKSGDFKPDLYHIIFAPSMEEMAEPAEPILKPKFKVLSEVGQVSSIREDPDIGLIHFHFCSGPTYWGHYHQDKGSFIIEVNDEVLAMDRGVASYDNPESRLLSMADRHNLLYPERINDRPLEQPYYAAGGKLVHAGEDNGVITLISDNKDAWEAGLFKKNIRKVVSSAPGYFIIEDEVVLSEKMPVSFLIHSNYDMQAVGNDYWIKGKKSSLCITPLNWRPAVTDIRVNGVDDRNQPVNTLRLTAEGSNSYHLKTAIKVVANR